MDKIFSSNAVVAYMALTLVCGIGWALGAPFQIPTIIAAAASIFGLYYHTDRKGDGDAGSGWFNSGSDGHHHSDGGHSGDSGGGGGSD